MDDMPKQIVRKSHRNIVPERFRTLADIACDWVWETDADNKFIYLSHQFKGTLDISENAVLGKTREQFAGADPDDINWKCHLEDIIQRREFHDFRYCKVNEDGEIFFFSINGTPQFDNHGEFTGYIGIGRNITAQTNAQREIERHRNLFRTIVKGIPNSLLFTNANRTIIATNPGFTNIFGYTQKEVIGRTTHFLFADPDCFDEFSGHDVPPHLTMEENEFVIHYRHKSGGTFPGKLIAAPVCDLHGEVSGYILFISDISGQMIIEQQLHQAQKMEAIGQLTGGIAHDFNNLLTIIIGNLRLIKETKSLVFDPTFDELMSDTLSAAKDGAELTNRLLMYSRNSPAIPKGGALEEMIKNVIGLTSRGMRDNITLRYVSPKKQVELFIDHQQFCSALMNLLLNAKDAMPDGGEIFIKTRTLYVSEKTACKNPVLKAGQYVCVQVIDNGTGMTPDTMSKACEPFFTTKEYGHGTGLGLTMVSGFTRQSGGDFRLSTNPGRGIIAEMIFPSAQIEDLSLSRRIKQQRQQHRPLKKQKPLTILTTEDDPSVRKLIACFLVSAGHFVLEASNAIEAQKIIDEHPEIDILISDVVMSGGFNGYQLARWTSQRYPGIKIVMATGQEDNNNPDKQYMADNCASIPVIKKPFCRTDLLDAIDDVLDT